MNSQDISVTEIRIDTRYPYNFIFNQITCTYNIETSQGNVWYDVPRDIGDKLLNSINQYRNHRVGSPVHVVMWMQHHYNPYITGIDPYETKKSVNKVLLLIN